MYSIIDNKDIYVFSTFNKVNEYWKNNYYEKYMFFKHDVYLNIIISDITLACTSYVYIPNNFNLETTIDPFGNEIVYINNCITCFEMNNKFYSMGIPEKVPIMLNPINMIPITQKEFVEAMEKTKQYKNGSCSPLYYKII